MKKLTSGRYPVQKKYYLKNLFSALYIFLYLRSSIFLILRVGSNGWWKCIGVRNETA